MALHPIDISLPAGSRRVPLLPLLKSMPDIPPYTATLGLADDGRPLWMRLSSPNVTHVLVAGVAGSGKTELMRTIAVSLALTNRPRHLQFALIDIEARGFAPLVNLPHLLFPPAFDSKSAAEMLQRLNTEMDRRDESHSTLPRIMVMVDEVFDLFFVVSGDVENNLIRLMQRGREAGIHVVIGSREVSTTFVHKIRLNLPARLVGKTRGGSEAFQATGIENSGAEELIPPGDFIAVASGEMVGRFQAAQLSDEDWEQLPRLLKK